MQEGGGALDTVLIYFFFILSGLLKCYLSSCAGVSEVSTSFQFIKLY